MTTASKDRGMRVWLKACSTCGGKLLYDDATNTLYCENAHLGGDHYRENPARPCPDCAGMGTVYGTDRRGKQADLCPRCDGSGQIGAAL